MRLVAASAAALLLTMLVRVSGAPEFGPTLAPNGQEIFRYHTFGDEQLWTDTLRMNEALENVTPATALAVGLKVDAEALPPRSSRRCWQVD